MGGMKQFALQGMLDFKTKSFYKQESLFQLWGPHRKYDMDLLEAVQRRTTKMEKRRFQGDLIAPSSI